MTWGEVLTRLSDAGLNPVEETYMEHYGKILAAQRSEFKDRYFRCTYGKVLCGGLEVELYLFPWEGGAAEFLEVIGSDRSWFSRDNLVLHFPVWDDAKVNALVQALTGKL